MLRIILHLFIVGAALGRPNYPGWAQKSESAILENISEKDVKYCMEFVKIISDTSLTKEQRVDKIEKAMLGDDVADDERASFHYGKTAIEAIDLFIDLNDWILEQVATASFKVWQVFTTLNYDDIKEFVELIKAS
ncbi:unnamed protein product [Heligmosomoides polygyrus]|uniref:Uncharacterized protein n=1 Tax=Heligmosomoides polygyrus TaxID=6339 RepID=A0A183FFP9_HELPZ|nr:unnamed protein product [Heligmosomoides polygyrus]